MSQVMLFLFLCLLFGFTITTNSVKDKTTESIQPEFHVLPKEEIAEENGAILELMRIKRGATHWNVSVTYRNTTTQDIGTPRNLTATTTPPTVNQMILITGSPIPMPTEMMVMEASKVRAPLFVQSKSSPVHVTRTVRYRTWVSNSTDSATEITPNHTGSASAEHFHLFAPSNQKIVHGIKPHFIEKNVPIPVIYTTRRRPEIRYYVPRKEGSQVVYQNKRAHPAGRGRIQLIQPVEDYDDEDDEESAEYDDESSEEEDEPPPRYNRNRFSPPPLPVHTDPPQIPVQTETPQITVNSQPATSTAQHSTNAVSTSTAATTPLSSTTTTTTSAPANVIIPPPAADGDSSFKKQVYLEHPVAYLMAHLPTSTLLPAPTHSATLPSLPTHSSLSESNFSPTRAPNISVTSPATLTSNVVHPQPVPIRPTQNSIESAESPEDYVDADYDDRPNSNDETKYRSTRIQPQPDYDDEVEEEEEEEPEEEEEDEEEEEEEQPQPVRVQQRQRHPPRVHHRRRPRVKKVRQHDYQEDYEDVQQGPQQKPVTIYVQRTRRPKAKPVYQEYVDERPTQTYLKGGRYRNQVKKHKLRNKPVIQIADGNDYYVNNNNNNNHHDPRKPNIIIAYEPEPSANHGHRSQKLVLANVNLPAGKIKWLRQLDHTRPRPHTHNLRHQGTIYQKVLHNQDRPQKSMQPVYTPHNIHSVSQRNENITRPRNTIIVPSTVKTNGRYVQLVPALAYSKPQSNDLQKGDYYAVVDNSRRLKPAQVVVHHPQPKENVYVYQQSHRKPQTQVDTYQCDWNYCRLPDCFCGTNALIPGNLKVAEVPQMILLTFDDSINEVNFPFYQSLFHSRKNPNGCPIKATFYVSHEWTDYSKVQILYGQGHEMASHSISHSDGARFNEQRWADEILGQKEILSTLGGVHRRDIRGMRAPFLQPGGDNQYSMLQATNFTYDSSLPIRRTDPPIWPYTLDYGVPHECNIAPCPKGSYPGLWEVPLVMWTDLSGGRCSMADACSAPTEADDVYRMLMANFERHYRTNKSPFPMYFHYAWFTKRSNFEAFAAFVDTVLQLGDVYFVTTTQMINWMRNPTPISQINEFAPWKCSNETQNAETCVKSTMCTFQFRGSERTARTCQRCPPAYPWVGNPRGMLLGH